MMARNHRTGMIVGVLLLACWPAAGQQRDLKPGFNLFSKEQDIQLGKEAAAEMEKKLAVVDRRELNEYVQRIGRKLAAQPEADRYPYTFKVVQDKSVNAFALPGGPTYVHTGLIEAAETEGQLAGVLAHEISHVALRHGTNQASKANLIQLPAMLAGAMIGDRSITGQLAQLGIGFGANSVLLKFSRSAERDADLLGARMMAAAGYNPIEMARFFEKLEAEGGSRGAIAQFLSSHPNPGNRTKAVEEEIRYLPQRSYDADSGELPRAKKIVGELPALKPGSKAPAGGGAAPTPAPAPANRPSGQFRQYRGRAYAISYPENWQTFGDRDSAMVTIAPREGIVQGAGTGTAVGYGVTVNYYITGNDRSVELQRHTAELIRQLQSANPGMRQARQASRRLRVDGQPALLTTLYSNSPYQGQSEVDLLLTVARPEGLFYMVFIAPQNEFRQVQGTFEEMLRSVRFSN